MGVGLFYRESYFRQQIDREGQQHAQYLDFPMDYFPATLLQDRTRASRCWSTCPLASEKLYAQIWQISVGRTPLLLLDTDVPQNSPENRELAARLYFGDQRVRIRQELLLGVGGIRALRAAGINWSLLHLNEGHSAFATLEYTRLRMESTGAELLGGGPGGGPVDGVHHPHPGRRRPRPLPARAGRRAPRAAAPLAGDLARGVPGPGAHPPGRPAPRRCA